jgi:NDP-sugar pyrophosphorylase family protein
VTPKALLPIANIPLIDRVVDSIQRVGIKDIIVVTGYLGPVTVKHLETSRKSSASEIKFVTADRYRDGPIYSLLAAERFIEDDFLLVPADLVLDHRILVKLIANHTQKDMVNVATSGRPLQTQRAFVLCYKRSRHDNSTIIRLCPPKNVGEESIREGRAQPYNSIGAVICPSTIFKYVHLAAERGSTRVVDALNEYIAKTRLGRCVTVGSEYYWFDVDTADDMLEANCYILRNTSSNSGNQSHFYPDRGTSITVDVSISHQAKLARALGPVLLGERCIIGEGSVIGPCVSIQDDCVVGRNTRISNAIILCGSIIDDSAMVDRAIVCGKETLSAVRPNRDVENE